MREFKSLLLQKEAAQMRTMARAWVSVEDRLEAQISAMAREAAESGQAMTAAQLYRMDRYRSLVSQARREYVNYAEYAAGVVKDGQLEYARMGLANAAGAIDAVTGVRLGFDRLPISAIQNMIGLAVDGSPLSALLKQRMVSESGAFARLTQTLIDATAQGWNPAKTARAMAGDLTAGLDKALTIARTEQLRVYRQAAVEQYRASGVVVGQKRLSAHDERVCAACLADEGTVYPLDKPIPDHPNGRCTGVPVVEGMPEAQWTVGESWLNSQDEATQRSILGPGRYDLWQSGTPLSAFVTKTSNQTWGGSLGVTPLRDVG